MNYIINRMAEVIREGGLRKLFQKIISYPVYVLYAMHGTLFIRNITSGMDLKALVDFAVTGYDGLIRPFQVPREILELISLVNERKPKTILEIGTATGGTLFLFSRVASEDALIISVDLPYGMLGGGYPAWRIPFYKAFASKGQEIELIRADSHQSSTREKIETILQAKRPEFLFIDGDHTYEGVKRDFELYAPLVRKGGIIALHDISDCPPETGCHVYRFWDEIKTRYRHIEIKANNGQRRFGIGVLYVD